MLVTLSALNQSRSIHLPCHPGINAYWTPAPLALTDMVGLTVSFIHLTVFLVRSFLTVCPVHSTGAKVVSFIVPPQIQVRLITLYPDTVYQQGLPMDSFGHFQLQLIEEACTDLLLI